MSSIYRVVSVNGVRTENCCCNAANAANAATLQRCKLQQHSRQQHRKKCRFVNFAAHGGGGSVDLEILNKKNEVIILSISLFLGWLLLSWRWTARRLCVPRGGVGLGPLVWPTPPHAHEAFCIRLYHSIRHHPIHSWHRRHEDTTRVRSVPSRGGGSQGKGGGAKAKIHLIFCVCFLYLVPGLTMERRKGTGPKLFSKTVTRTELQVCMYYVCMYLYVCIHNICVWAGVGLIQP